MALSSLACRTTTSKIPLEKLESDASDQREGEARDVVEPLPVERPTDLLPAEVAVMAEAIDPAVLLELFDPLDKYQEFSTLRVEARSRMGADIFDAEQWAQLGLDSHGPAGVGMLDIDSEAWFVYLSLLDAERFEQTIVRFADNVGVHDELSSTEVAGAQVYRLGREASVVVREQVALLVVVDEPERAPRDYVVTAVTIDPRESLGHSERHLWAREQLAASDDGFVFVNPSELLVQFERAEHQDSGYGVRYAQDELARARAANDPPQMIREYEARVEEERRWQREREARRAGERELSEAVFGSIAAFVGAADLRKDGVSGHGRALIPNSSMLRRLFVTPEHESPLIAALAEPPIFALDGRIDLQVMLEAIELLARAEGESLESINRELFSKFGVDLIGVSSALTGEGGVVLTQARKPDPKHLDEVPKSIGLAAYVGLQDAAVIREALDRIARDKLMANTLVRAKRGDGWVVRMPEWHDVALAIVGDRLVLSTDAKLTARIRDAERGAFAESLTVEHPLRGPITNPAMRMYGRWVGAVLVSARAPWEQDAESMLYDINTHHVLNPDEAAKVPRSREYKRKLAELEDAIDELNEYNRRSARAQFERALEYGEQLGDAGWQLEPVSDGLALAGQWRFAAGMTPLGLGYKLFMVGEARDWDEYERLSTRMFTLVEELRQIRQADLDAAAAKRSK